MSAGLFSAVSVYVSCDQLRGLVAWAHSSLFCGLAFMSHAIMSGIGGCCLHAHSSFSGGWPLPLCPMLFFMWPGVHSRPVTLFLLLDSCVVKQEGGAVGDEHLRDHFSCSSCSGGLGLFFMWPVATTGLWLLFFCLARLNAQAGRRCWRRWAPEGSF